jgi:hypothetical protein
VQYLCLLLIRTTILAVISHIQHQFINNQFIRLREYIGSHRILFLEPLLHPSDLPEMLFTLRLEVLRLGVSGLGLIIPTMDMVGITQRMDGDIDRFSLC